MNSSTTDTGSSRLIRMAQWFLTLFCDMVWATGFFFLPADPKSRTNERKKKEKAGAQLNMKLEPCGQRVFISVQAQKQRERGEQQQGNKTAVMVFLFSGCFNWWWAGGRGGGSCLLSPVVVFSWFPEIELNTT